MPTFSHQPSIKILNVVGADTFVKNKIYSKGMYLKHMIITRVKEALTKIQKVGDVISREFEILMKCKESDTIVQMIISNFNQKRTSFIKGQKTIDQVKILSLNTWMIHFSIEYMIRQLNYFRNLQQKHIITKSFKDQSLFIKKVQYTVIQNLKNISFNTSNNIMINDKGEVKLCDFGYSKIFNLDSLDSQIFLSI
ncbi:unnamed protein product [Paramecium sonneborni]|uniref:Protein kinase domain-containing protein n=1 Tax=Paramecium sonneborni TaxID=65129 RepID=A0A8S1RPT4_9CILI|nr:unnamed protein product [Paramecium sonneborni]